MANKDIQQALQQAGFDPGPIDGVIGRNTIRAIRAFQQAKGLVVDGVVGPKTAAKLFAAGGAPAEEASGIPSHLPWLQEAFRLIGTREQPGAGSNQAILKWAEDLSIDFNTDATAWCGLFTAHCLGAQLPDEALPTTPLLARAWERFGQPTTPCLGSVMVFWRKSPSSGFGHVGFYWAENSAGYQILGGNQSDAVNIRFLGKERFLKARWPRTAPQVEKITRGADAAGVIRSTTEA